MFNRQVFFETIGRISSLNHSSMIQVAKLNNDNIPRSNLGAIGERHLVSKLVIHNYDHDNIHRPFSLSPSQLRRTSSRSSTNRLPERRELGDSAVASRHYNPQNAYLFLLSMHWSAVTCSGVFCLLREV